MSEVYQKDLSFAQIQVLVRIFKHPLGHVPDRAGQFGTGGTCSYDDEIQRSFGDEPGIPISGFQDCHYSRTK